MATYQELYNSQVKAFVNFMKKYHDTTEFAEKPMEDLLAIIYTNGAPYESVIEGCNVKHLKPLVLFHPQHEKLMAVIDEMTEEDLDTCAKFLKWIYHFAKEFITGPQ